MASPSSSSTKNGPFLMTISCTMMAKLYTSPRCVPGDLETGGGGGDAVYTRDSLACARGLGVGGCVVGEGAEESSACVCVACAMLVEAESGRSPPGRPNREPGKGITLHHQIGLL